MNKKVYYGSLHELPMVNFFQLDSISISNFYLTQRKEDSSGKEGDGMERQKIVLGSGRRSYLFRVFLLEVSDWLKCREDIEFLSIDVG